MLTPGLHTTEPESPSATGTSATGTSATGTSTASTDEASDEHATPELQPDNTTHTCCSNTTGRCVTVSRTTLVVLNFYLLVLGVAFLVGGVVMIYSEDTWQPLMHHGYHDSLIFGLRDAGVTIDTSNFSLSSFAKPIANYLFGFGTAIGLVALFGCYGSIPKIRASLTWYFALLSVLLVIQCVLVINPYGNWEFYTDTVKSTFIDSLNEFSGIEGSDTNTLAWNAVMKRWGCCGVEDYLDFQGLPKWPPETIGNTTVGNILKTPIMCCKGSTNFSVTGMFMCAMKAGALDTNNNMHIGCYDVMFDHFVHHYIVTFLVLVSFSFQSVLVISSGSLVLIARRFRKSELEELLAPADPLERNRQQSSEGSDFGSEMVSAKSECDSDYSICSTAKSPYASPPNTSSPSSKSVSFSSPRGD